MNATVPVRIGAVAALFALAGCQSLPNVSPGQGQLIGAGTGALVGAATSDGIIAPVIGAVGGAALGKELAERDPLLD